MASIKDFRSAYYDHSGKASDISRQLAFAGIAVVWIFRVSGDGGGFEILAPVVLPLILFVSSLGLDLAQYVFQASTWGIYSRFLERSGDNYEKTDLAAPPWFNWFPILFWILKVGCVILGYILLLRVLTDWMIK